MHEFGVRFFNGKNMVACYLINAPTNEDAEQWSKVQGDRKHEGCDVSIECFGAHQ